MKPSKKPVAKQRDPRIAEVLIPVAVALMTFLAFLPVLKAEFLNTWDDPSNITDNPLIQALNITTLKGMFTTQVGSGYIPLTLLSYAVEVKLFGLSPFVVHLDNLILHILGTVVVFFILRRLSIRPVFAGLGALLYGVHPMGVESVAWASERKDVLYAFFYLASMLAYLNYTAGTKRRYMWLAASLGLFVLSLLSKIQAVSLPLALLALDFMLKRPIRAKVIAEKVPYFLLSLAFGIIGTLILRDLGALRINEFYTLTERIFLGSHTYVTYLWKFLIPVPLSALYPYPALSGQTFPILVYLSPLLIAGVAAGGWYSLRKSRVPAAGLLFFTLTVMFMLQIFGAGQGYMADRFTRIPYVGLILIVAWGLQLLAEKNPKYQFLIVICATGLMTNYMNLTYDRCTYWENSETLWTDVIKKYPGRDARAYGRLGIYYKSKDRYEEAAAMFSTHLRLDPGNAEILNYRGNVYFSLKKYDSAYCDYIQALKKNADDPLALGNLGVIYISRNQYDSALSALNRSLTVDTNQGPAYANRGVVYVAMHRPEEAINDFKRYLRVRPDDPQVLFTIAAIYSSVGKDGESLPYFNRAIELSPGQGRYIYNRGKAKMKLGDRAGAEADFQRAAQLGFSGG